MEKLLTEVDMITVEIGVQNGEVRTDEIEIYFDKEGLDYLLHRLEHIHAGTTDHVHLMSESWGLDDLAESLPYLEIRLLIIFE